MTENPTSSAENTSVPPANIPIVLNMNLEKVNYLLGLLGTCPYEKSYMVIHDIQALASPQLDAYNKAAELAKQAPKPAEPEVETTE